MSKARRTFSTARKKAIIQEAIDKRSVAEVLTKYKLADSAFYRWVRLFRPDWSKVFDPKLPRQRKQDRVPVSSSTAGERQARLEKDNVRLEQENVRLRRIVVEQMLEIELLEGR